MKGKIEEFFIDSDGKQVVVFKLYGDFRKDYEKYHDFDVELDVKKWHPKKTDAENRFMWVLCNKIAEKISTDPKEVYRKGIRETPGVSSYLCIPDEDVDEQCEIWESMGIGFQTKRMPSRVPGCTTVLAYKGSSIYNTKQMSDLIGNLIYDAEELGINTDTPDKEAYWDQLIESGYKGSVYNGARGYKEFL